MAVPPVRAVELERFESTFNRTRLGGAAITFLLGPFFPNIGLAHVVLFGALLLVQFGFVTYVIRSGTFRRDPENASRLIFTIDLVLIAYAIVLFSYDPNWTTYIVGMLVIIAGGFRFAAPGSLVSSIAMALTYVIAVIYRDRSFGYVTEPQRVIFTVSIYLIGGFLMSGILRELATLRSQREAFERQRAETEALRTLDRMKSDFLAEMSHDFRSPITVVRGALELLLSERPGPLTTAQRGLGERADRNVKRLEEFSEDLLEMARIEHGTVALERVEVDACALVREVADDQRTIADGRGQTVQVRCRDETITVLADVGRLRRAIGNLVANAIKYGPERSAIVIQTLREGVNFTVRVTDDGPGVAPEDREHIFEKFARGRRGANIGGVGLGLAIARSLAELHGGSLRYEDAEGGGATFVLTVPLGIE